jgi:hypothetical protein
MEREIGPIPIKLSPLVAKADPEKTSKTTKHAANDFDFFMISS